LNLESSKQLFDKQAHSNLFLWRPNGLHIDMKIPDRAIQVGGAKEGQSFVLKV
jgi:hypothetical protein